MSRRQLKVNNNWKQRKARISLFIPYFHLVLFLYFSPRLFTFLYFLTAKRTVQSTKHKRRLTILHLFLLIFPLFWCFLYLFPRLPTLSSLHLSSSPYLSHFLLLSLSISTSSYSPISTFSFLSFNRVKEAVQEKIRNWSQVRNCFLFSYLHHSFAK